MLLQNFIIICKNFPHLKWGFALYIACWLSICFWKWGTFRLQQRLSAFLALLPFLIHLDNHQITFFPTFLHLGLIDIIKFGIICALTSREKVNMIMGLFYFKIPYKNVHCCPVLDFVFYLKKVSVCSWDWWSGRSLASKMTLWKDMPGDRSVQTFYFLKDTVMLWWCIFNMHWRPNLAGDD